MTREQRLLEAYQQAAEVHRIATRAVRKAQAESRRLGVPNVYSRNGQLYYDHERPATSESSGEDIHRGDSDGPDAAPTGQS